ncbi:PspA/IM30 family protein [Deinococcus roseus]|uniref:Phage shock protein A n=1 Tax=Deinococcus roseus TaxID=392414 RepID=A0ABQ2CVB2_9DEIO|nr:PspA/IM30 family protein [Deinococcus roseus]GGJ24306.1 phage shock protein A [Deinococcus roseus]
MSILDRLSRLIRANVNDLISRAEDPEKIIEQSMMDMRDAYAQARKEVAESMAQGEKLKREQMLNKKLSEEYVVKAQEALKLGNENLAREALTRKKNYEDIANAYSTQIQQQDSIIEELKTQLRALEGKISEFQAKKELLQARQKGAEATQTLERISGFDKSKGAMSAFEDMERKVSGMEDQAKAMGQLRKESDIDEQLKDLGRDKEIDEELEALKRSMGQS